MNAQINFIIIIIIIFILFSYSAQPKVAMHCNCSCGAKKYSFGSTIVGHILVFGSAKNSNIAI